MSARKVPELPENVVLLRPEVWKGPKRKAPARPRRFQPKTTPSPDFHPSTTEEKPRNAQGDNGFHPSAWSFQEPVPKEVRPSTENRRDAARAEFERQVQSLSAMGLRHRFKDEATSHRMMKGRRRDGAVIHPLFEDFRSFLLIVGPRRSPNLTLDRLDPLDPEYGPGKVAWRDKEAQANNRSTTLFLTARGRTLPLTEWARETGQKPKTIRQRLYRNASDEAAIFGTDAPPVAPERATPVEQPVEAEGYGWPGSRPHVWEQGFRGFVAVARRHPYLRLYPAHAFTRDVFLAWVGGNILSEASRILREKYPGFDDPECDEPPAAALADPVHRRIDVLRLPQDWAMRRIRGSKAEYDLWLHTLRRFSDVRTLPQDWAYVFRSLDRTNQRR